MIKEILAAISQGKKFLITAHVRLDGDALGSELALYLMLKDLGKEAVICNQDPTPAHYRFLPGADQIVHSLEQAEHYDVGFVLDSSELERVGKIAADVARIKTLINIDHHISNAGFCRLRFVDAKASSTGELLHRLMRKMHVKMTKEICTNLYAAILTDTGGFRYSTTHQETLRSAAELVEGGADPQWISENIYESDPPAKLQLLARTLESLTLDMETRTASLVVTQKDLLDTGATMELTDGFVDIPRTVKGISIAMLYTQLGEKQFKLSLRSKGKVDVERIARRFGGGGHINASACRIDGDIDTIKARVLEVVMEG
ncbi:MAG: bifunctional oligoribonuclease/PAP phosphatase NrnA [Deltaproteobacteria bacterium]|nr:bifunctional oligoribonuclease/PAP phosphatase NrnA [Deltaproteobacteria bacterium]